MDRLSLIISGFTGAAGQFGEIAAQIILDRLELLALELPRGQDPFCPGIASGLHGCGFFPARTPVAGSGRCVRLSARTEVLRTRCRGNGQLAGGDGCLYRPAPAPETKTSGL